MQACSADNLVAFTSAPEGVYGGVLAHVKNLHPQSDNLGVHVKKEHDAKLPKGADVAAS